ncbi:methyl-accepting chemotaxis protein, partial [Rhizobium sp.]|uniref:cache domain-containing protein n=1 Tax=Rhizobium sp. TaxID=391 RepID=UPI000E88F12E|nr:chemotaxis protein [Rhizobium sp.]
MSNLSVLKKIFLLMGLSLIIMAGALFYSGQQSYNSIVAERKAMLMNIDHTAISIFKRYQSLETEGKMSREAAQKDAIAQVMAMRYGTDGYLWINDLNGMMVAHAAKPALNNTSVLGMKDSNGVFIFQEFIKIGKTSGEGDLDYLWPKPGSDQPVGKNSHVILFEPWGWIVGTGVYNDDIVALRQKQMLATGIIMVLAAIATICGSVAIGRSISTPLNALKVTMINIAANDTAGDIPHTHRRDEIGQMAAALVNIKNSVIERIQLESNRVASQAEIEHRRQQQIDSERHNSEKQAAVVNSFAEALESLSKGNLTVRLADLPADYRKLETDFNKAVSILAETLEKVAESTMAVGRSVDEINAAVTDLSKRTEGQAANLEETAAAIEDITRKIQSSEGSIEKARAMAMSAKDDAAKSSTIVTQAVSAMGLIEQSSTKINDIISGIDEIAFQT